VTGGTVGSFTFSWFIQLEGSATLTALAHNPAAGVTIASLGGGTGSQLDLNTAVYKFGGLLLIPGTHQIIARGSALFSDGTVCPFAQVAGDLTIKICGGSLVTDTEYCVFDVAATDCTAEQRQQLRLIFTPDGPAYKLNGNNPGQFYYNVFANGLPAGEDAVFNITLPYPFVTHGANPIHGYEKVGLTENSAGAECVPPVNPAVFVSSDQVVIGDYGEGATFGDTYPLTITVPAANIPVSGSLNLTIHLQYGLKGTTGYCKGSSDDATTYVGGATGCTSTVRIYNCQAYEFSVSGAVEDSQTVESVNSFKKNPGIGGQNSITGTEKPVAGATVVLKNGKTVLTSGKSDEDGWYMLPYKWTGKAATLTVTMTPPPGGGSAQTKTITLKANGFIQVDFIVP
jgi:hypothetical protein